MPYRKGDHTTKNIQSTQAIVYRLANLLYIHKKYQKYREYLCPILVISCLRANFEMSQQVLKRFILEKNARLVQFKIIMLHSVSR